MEQLDLKEFEF